MSTPVYVYGLASGLVSLPEGLPAVDAPQARIECLAFGKLSALVSDITATRLDPLRRHLLAHTRVLELALEAGGLLPMRFGIIVSSRERLAALMARHAKIIADNLHRIENCIEVGVKASWSPDGVWSRVRKSDPAVAQECARLNQADPHRAYFDRIDAGRRVAAALNQLRADDGRKLDQLARPFSMAMRTLPPTDDMMFAHRALLVSRKAEPALYAAVQGFAKEGIDVRYVAPVPPYNFVDLALAGDEFNSEAA